MHHALIWFLVVQLLGLLALPLAYSLFRRLPDRGFTLAVPLGLLLGSYLFWVAGLTHVLPNSRYTIIGVLALVALASGLLLRRTRSELWAFIRGNWVVLLAAELVFIGLYSLWLSMLALSPAINHTEMPMDFAFLNSILRSDHFPPEDPWLSGYSVSYYYFGHFMMAFLTKLTSIPSSVSYNLSIALISAIAGVGVFGLVYNLVRLSGARLGTAVLFGFTAPLFLGLIGNLEGVLEFVYSAGWGSNGFWEWVSIKGLEGAPSGGFSFFPEQHWWWWKATRVIDTLVDGASLDYTITEFPFFSFYLADLHPHVSALPFITLVLGLGLNLFVSDEKLGFAWLRKYPLEVLAIALALGSLSFINTWDFPILATIFAALVLAKAYGESEGDLAQSLLASLYVLAPVLAGAVIFYIPFYATLESQASGVLPLGEVATRPLFFFIIWGLFSVLCGSFLIKQVWTVPGLTGRNPGLITLVATITLAPLLIWGVLELFFLWTGWNALFDRLGGRAIEDVTTVGKRSLLLLPGLAIVGVGLYSMLLRTRRGGDSGTAFALLLVATAFYLLVGAELFYVVDLFGNRMNTVFKFYYEAWLLLAVASAYGLYYLCSRPMPSIARVFPAVARSLGTRFRVPTLILGKGTVFAWVGLVAVLLLASLYYSVAAVISRTDSGGGDGPILDGLAFLDTGRSGEYEAILWLRDEAPWGRIVEATDDSYTPYGRISASTGLPTMLGWKGHERQWRGPGINDLLDEREKQVAQIYTSDDSDTVQRLLETHNIRYVYVGRRERKEYGASEFAEFSSFLQPVFQSKDVVVYERQQPGDGA